jgi:hypothetical protein
MFTKINGILINAKMMNHLVFPLLLIFLISCVSNQREPVPDVSKVYVDLHLIRFERELFQLDTNAISQSLSKLYVKYPSFAELFFEEILSIKKQEDTMNTDFENAVKQFITDPEANRLNELVQKEFPDHSELEKELKTSLQFMKYYFPSENEPVFYTLISEFSYGNFIFKESKERDGIGIGLDFFLGDAFDYKKIDPRNPAFSEYLNRCFNKDHLLKKTWNVWIEDRLGDPSGGKLLDYIIQRGKKLYTLTKLLPEIQDTVLFEYTPGQLEWCNKNKVEIWSYFLANNLLYSTELLKFNKYVNPSPNSPGMPPEAPGQTGSYIGYQIISSYMKRHPKLSLEELWKISDSQMLLNESRFKPRND